MGSLLRKMTKQNKWPFSYCSPVQLERNGIISWVWHKYWISRSLDFIRVFPSVIFFAMFFEKLTKENDFKVHKINFSNKWSVGEKRKYIWGIKIVIITDVFWTILHGTYKRSPVFLKTANIWISYIVDSWKDEFLCS